VDKQHSTAPEPHPSTDEHPHACIEGVVFIGRLIVADDGEEVEVIEAVPCRRCADSR
jgi:hypothetical protein